MKSKRLLNMIGEIDDKYIAEAAPRAKKQRWIKWAAAAACLVLFTAIGITFIGDITKDQDDLLIDTMLLIEYDNAYYEIVENYPEALERRGIDAELTTAAAGGHVAYLQKENIENERSNYIEASSETDIELLEYAPAPCRAVRIFRDGDRYFAALFCNYLISDEESLPFADVFEINGINGAEDIVSITPVKSDNWKKIGDEITDPALISDFYSEIIALEAYSEDAYDKAEFSHIDESDADEYHSEYAKDRKDIVIEASNGLSFKLHYYPGHGWIYGSSTQTYYKMTPAMQEWFEKNIL